MRLLPRAGTPAACLAWVLWGLITYWAAAIPVGLLITGLALHAGLQVSWLVLLGTAAQAITATLGYLALRYGLLPPDASGRRGALPFAALVVLGMLPVTTLALLTGLVLGYAGLQAVIWLAPSGAWSAAVAPFLVIGLSYAAAGALAGAGLYGVERTCSHRLRGGAPPRRLLRAHATGGAALAVLAVLPGVVVSVAGFWEPASAAFLFAVGGRLAVLPHLLLTWWAWCPVPARAA